MTEWELSRTPCGKCALLLSDEQTGVRFAMVFPDADRLKRFLDAVAAGISGQGASFEAMSVFVKEFPERF